MRNVPLDFALGWAALGWADAEVGFMAISMLVVRARVGQWQRHRSGMCGRGRPHDSRSGDRRYKEAALQRELRDTRLRIASRPLNEARRDLHECEPVSQRASHLLPAVRGG